MLRSLSFYTYLPQDARERLHRYKYHGEDRSYIYKYLWSALCRYVVNFLPLWLAPNVITIVGLIIVCISHATLAYYMPKLTAKDVSYLTENEKNVPYRNEFLPQPPPFVFVLVAASMFIYQFLDNLDGHQARRTGTASPLGLLVDHGCDAFNCIISSLSIAATVSAGPCWKTWVIVLNTVTTFFMNTWEEYYRGILVLPVINGPNEGIVIAIGIYLWTAWVGGPRWWYDNTIEIPVRCLLEMLRQPAPDAAVSVERKILQSVCPFQTYFGCPQGNNMDFALLPFILHLNCSESYVKNPPRPTLVAADKNSWTACHEELVMSEYWSGHSMLQKIILCLYNSGQQSLNVRYNTLFVWFMTLAVVLTCSGNVYQVYKAIRQRTYLNQQNGEKDADGAAQVISGSWVRHHFPFLHSLVQLSPLVVLVFMANAFFFASQENIFRRHPRIFCWTVGLLFTKLTIHLILAHLCSVEFQPFRRTFLPLLLFGVHTALKYFHSASKLMRQRLASGLSVTFLNDKNSYTDVPCQSMGAHSRFTYAFDENLVLHELFVLSVVAFSHLVWSAVREMAFVLEVPVFRVPFEKQEMLRKQIIGSKTQATYKKKEIKNIVTNHSKVEHIVYETVKLKKMM